MTAGLAVVCGLFGLVVGSFLNVVIWRVPRKESIVSPPSHCPGCDNPIAPYDNIPVISWLVLRGKCRHCGTHISIRYPLIELGTGLLWAATAVRFHDSWVLPAYLLLAAALVVISAIDLEHYLIPNRIIYPVGFMAVPLLALGALGDDTLSYFWRALAAAVVAFVVFFLIFFFAPQGGFGFGDVRLSVVLGLYLGYLGWKELMWGLFLGFLFGAVIGVVLLATGSRTRKQHIPFGPFMALGAMTIILVGGALVDLYP